MSSLPPSPPPLTAYFPRLPAVSFGRHLFALVAVLMIPSCPSSPVVMSIVVRIVVAIGVFIVASVVVSITVSVIGGGGRDAVSLFKRALARNVEIKDCARDAGLYRFLEDGHRRMADEVRVYPFHSVVVSPVILDFTSCNNICFICCVRRGLLIACCVEFRLWRFRMMACRSCTRQAFLRRFSCFGVSCVQSS